MTLALRLANSAVKGLARIMCRVDDAELSKVPARGPLLLVANHVNLAVQGLK